MELVADHRSALAIELDDESGVKSFDDDWLSLVLGAVGPRSNESTLCCASPKSFSNVYIAPRGKNWMRSLNSSGNIVAPFSTKSSLFRRKRSTKIEISACSRAKALGVTYSVSTRSSCHRREKTDRLPWLSPAKPSRFEGMGGT